MKLKLLMILCDVPENLLSIEQVLQKIIETSRCF